MEGVTWLEVADARGAVVARARLDRLPFVIGRGYGSDLIIDDPQVCPEHLRIDADEAGLKVTDLGSVNGLWTAAGERIAAAVVTAGDAVRVGRSTLRFRGAADAVPPTQPAAAARPDRRLAAGGPRAALLLGAAAIGVETVRSYLGSYNRTDPAEQVAEALMYAVVFVVYAGIWAFVSRVTAHRFNFLAHLTIAAAGALAMAGLTIVSEYIAFLAPEAEAAAGVVAFLMLGLGGGVLYWHLEFATGLRTQSRALVSAAIVCAVVLLAAVSDWEEEFSAYPAFSAVVKPFGAGLAPLSTSAELVSGVAELAEEVDELAEEPLR